jgi:hypothetical protein
MKQTAWRRIMNFLKGLFSRSPKTAAAPTKSRAQAKRSTAAKRKSGASAAMAARTKDAKTFGKVGQNKPAPKKKAASKSG